ncbi:MAG: hypothetical protein FJ279_26290 [Planctomycetes bacterium]|nr:hypothetical protein [Planctomycetota bacterium]MBM4083198.1 hypothetical protein [Planctomycetota bacterium]
MSPNMARRDMIVLVADRNMEAAVRGILGRHEALGIRPVHADIRRHPEKDCGCRVAGVEYLSPFVNQYEHAMLMFDLEGCGEEEEPAPNQEAELEEGLRNAGWDDRAAAIVVEPELDVWVWSDSPHVVRELGWWGREPGLWAWLSAKGFGLTAQRKPARPKEALEAALWAARKPRSSAIYQSLAEKVSLAKCTDRAFLKLKATLKRWF